MYQRLHAYVLPSAFIILLSLKAGLSFTTPSSQYSSRQTGNKQHPSFEANANANAISKSCAFVSERGTKSSTWLLYQPDENMDEGDAKDEKEKEEGDLTWIQKAMGMSPEDQTPKLSVTPPLQSGISGFAVDPKLGFVCVLASDTDEDEDGGESAETKFTYAIVSSGDREKLSSPEALCLVQLAGGLDLGAAVFPPETLARVVAAELNDENEEDEINVEDLRSKVTLLAVTADKNEHYNPNDSDNNVGTSSSLDTTGEPASSPERDVKIKDAAAKILPAVKNLPGLTDVTNDQIISAMQNHADDDGKLDRQAFSELLGTLRGRSSGASNRMDGQKVKLRITASVLETDSSSPSKLVVVDHVPPFQAIALALRYKVRISVSEDCFNDEDGTGDGDGDETSNVLKRFPAFKPVQELVEDAQGMNGFISSMFFKETAPDNDDKAQ